MFSCEFCEISKNTFSIEHLETTASVFAASKTQPLLRARSDGTGVSEIVQKRSPGGVL